jgi:FtsZ-binding cell division protein ZapB
MDSAKSADVVSHIGLASSLISIVLALVAIGYTYYRTPDFTEDLAQIRSAIEGVVQINTAVDSLKESADTVSQSSSQVESATAALKDKVEAIPEQIETVQTNLFDLQNMLADSIQPKQVPVPNNIERKVVDKDLLLPRLNGWLKFVFFWIAVSNESQKPLNLREVIPEIDPNGWAIYSVASFCRDLGLMSDYKITDNSLLIENFVYSSSEVDPKFHESPLAISKSLDRARQLLENIVDHTQHSAES